jgi:hypothetical protein
LSGKKRKKPSQELLTKPPIEALITNKKSTKQVNFSKKSSVEFPERKLYNSECHAEVAQLVEQRTENPRVASSILALGTIKRAGGSSSAARMPPCQGGGRGFESRLPLHQS